jgi:zinc and cadmium transporter
VVKSRTRRCSSHHWRDKKVLLANVLTAFGTLVAAIITYSLSDIINIPLAELLAVTSGIFIYIAASDIIPDIHEQPRRLGTVQAGVLVAGIVVVGLVIRLLGV